MIPVYEIVSSPDSLTPFLQPSRDRDPLSTIGGDTRVSLTSSNADARTLLLWLAQQGGVNLVVSQDVRARVSVNFADVPVSEAMRAVMAQAGLSFLVGDELSPWPPVVFYQLPIDINQASAEVIASRFGISIELARWIVESRVRP
jgi:hypothetical protein